MAAKPSVVLHTSWRGRFTTTLAPLVLLALGAYGLADQFRWVPFVIALLGLGLALVAIADYPIVTILGADGIERVCLVRRQRLGWDQVSTLARPSQMSRWRRDDPTGGAGGMSPTTLAGLRPAHEDRTILDRPKGGLVAEIRRRPYLLCDRSESQAEYDTIVESVAQWAPGLVVRASRPDASVAPTWLHKKRRGSATDGLVDLLA